MEQRNISKVIFTSCIYTHLLHPMFHSRKQAFRIKEDGIHNEDVVQSLSGAEEQIEKKVVKRQKRLARFLIGTTLCFVFCWLPYNLVSFYFDLTESEIALIFLPFTLLLGHSYSAFDPFVYLYLVRKKKQKKDIIYMRSLLFQASKKSWNNRDSYSQSKERSKKDFDCRTSTIILEQKTCRL
ncbi:tachykinin-like peptides receptor 86C [Leptotrombidium deliense]|uniref:Tachykinin-like peptides receptor 86C n=1 Tax=Leptotrombidium deliense TaxID=299467 RepID=A0A443SGQ8_9ACAR|nr:tachykinin-like peptides receptor 86C [Leptotrombidium deliense]